MMLKQIEIRNFRGIAFLSLSFRQISLLIGENAWGKSSLLDALTLMMSPAAGSSCLTENDFFRPQDDEPARTCLIELTFGPESPDGSLPATLAALLPADPAVRGLRFSFSACRTAQGMTQGFSFPDYPDVTESVVYRLIQHVRVLCPVLRLRDARFSPPGLAGSAGGEGVRAAELPLAGRAPEGETLQGAEVLQQALSLLCRLSGHYFHIRTGGVLSELPVSAEKNDLLWQQLNTLNRKLAKTARQDRAPILRALLMLLAGTPSAGTLPEGARPLILLEDPETRLHPMMLSMVWQFLALLPAQKVVTTNSSDLVSMVPLESIYRLDRYQQITRCWHIPDEGMSRDELRKVTFHIQVNRPTALFARCWLLVEGETEVWLINELARQTGFSLASEGIRVVEFAQSGLKPLLRFAAHMGIRWHVLTDGDEAGAKYAAIATSHLTDQQAERHHLTRFPAPDIEHYFYRNGFAEVYRQAAQLPEHGPGGVKRVITRAIQHSSKPSLAIAVASEVAERGSQSIPWLLRKMIGRVRGLARGRYG
ncbi:ATP-dependent endonuclease [Tatumella sp. JGM118]|uniref:ATP-dependent nuclease n=1 Tax=Tatumella sp. JGM118 TaxID=2799796 RepID=UPI001BB01389|nr:ATP-dependent endonuclease [Tatumella sp. JGM118]MBS0909688.1 ATP-dependent endonuclease [Tatumella sp. JGM118]